MRALKRRQRGKSHPLCACGLAERSPHDAQVWIESALSLLHKLSRLLRVMSLLALIFTRATLLDDIRPTNGSAASTFARELI